MVGRISQQFSVDTAKLYGLDTGKAPKAPSNNVHKNLGQVANSTEQLTTKTVHFSDIKTLNTVVDKAILQVKENLAGLQKNNGWNRPDKSMTMAPLNNANQQLQAMKDKLASTTYQHHAGKPKALDKMQTKLDTLAAKVGNEFRLSDQQLHHQKAVAANNAKSKAASAETKSALRDKFNEWKAADPKTRGDDPMFNGGMVK